MRKNFAGIQSRPRDDGTLRPFLFSFFMLTLCYCFCFSYKRKMKSCGRCILPVFMADPKSPDYCCLTMRIPMPAITRCSLPSTPVRFKVTSSAPRSSSLTRLKYVHTYPLPTHSLPLLNILFIGEYRREE